MRKGVDGMAAGRELREVEPVRGSNNHAPDRIFGEMLAVATTYRLTMLALSILYTLNAVTRTLGKRIMNT